MCVCVCLGVCVCVCVRARARMCAYVCKSRWLGCTGVGVWGPTLAVASAPASVCGCVCALVCAGSVRASGQGVRADRAGSGIPGPLADTGLGYSDRGGRLAGRKAEFLGTIRLGLARMTLDPRHELGLCKLERAT